MNKNIELFMSSLSSLDKDKLDKDIYNSIDWSILTREVVEDNFPEDDEQEPETDE